MFNERKFRATLAYQGISMKALAEAIGMDESTLYRKTHGISEFSRKEIQDICEFLKLDSPVGIFFDNELAKTQE